MWLIIIHVTQSVQRINNKYEDNIVSGGLFFNRQLLKVHTVCVYIYRAVLEDSLFIISCTSLELIKLQVFIPAGFCGMCVHAVL